MEEVMTIPMSVGNTEPIPMSVENEEQIPMGMDMQIVAGGSVYSVNGQTGDVVLTASDVDALPSTTEIPSKTSDLVNDSGFLISAVTSFNGQSGEVTYTAPISSVNGQTGDVVLNASDVNALPSSTSIPTKTSDLVNDSGYLSSAVTTFNGQSGAVTYTAPVSSVNGKTGNVNLSASDVGALPNTTTIPTKTSDLQNDSGYLTSAVTSFNGQSGAVTYTAPVSSVNSQTGSVVLTASDVGALADTTTIPTKTSDLTNDSGYITGMTILSYGKSTWQDFLDAYHANKVVYCRASSNANPATGSQTRMAFMAYVSNETSPANVEFQYYRSVSTHTASQQGDQVYIYTLKSTGWSVSVREASVKVAAGTGLSMAYSNGTATLSANIANATTSASGLMSATDKSNLDTLMDDYSSALVALGVIT